MIFRFVQYSNFIQKAPLSTVFSSTGTTRKPNSEIWTPFEIQTFINRLNSPVFKWHSKSRPFGNWTHFGHLNIELVWYSDDNCSFFGFISHYNHRLHSHEAHSQSLVTG